MRDWREEIRRELADARLAAEAEAEIVEELGQHLEDLYGELRARGTPEDEAVRLTMEELRGRSLGRGLRGVKPGEGRVVALGGAANTGWLAGAGQDIRFALRTFRLNLGFSSAAVLALGLGVGAATAVFSLLNGVVLRPLPYQEPERLVMLWESNSARGLERDPVSPVNLVDYRRVTSAFADVAAWWRPEVNLVDGAGEPIRVSTVEASENLFDVLGVQPILGRGFPVDSTLHTLDQSEAVISHRLWRNRFGGERSVIGRSLRLNGYSYTIVGVMPPSFQFPEETDVWQRLGWDLSQHSRGAHFMNAVGRLRPGVTLERANAELRALTTRLEREFPATNRGRGAYAVPLAADVAGVFRPGLFALLGASGLLLLIACINVANLLLARAAARQTEVAVRSALGASRVRLVRQFFFESLVLAGAGTLLGFVVAIAAVRAFLSWTPIDIPRADEVGVSGVVLLFTAAVAVLTALIFGLTPALLASRANLQSAMKESSRGATGRSARHARSVLVVAEVALAVALLSGAGLLIRSVAALLQEESGVVAANVVSVDVQLPDADYQDWLRVERFYSALLPALRQQPQLAEVGASNFLPLEAGWRIPFIVVGAEPSPTGEPPSAQYHTVDEGYFRTLGIPLLKGRQFEARDDADAPGVVIVNESLARTHWPGEDPVGKRIQALARGIGPLGRRLVTENVHEVVGVVADVKNSSLKAEAEPAIFSTARQFPFRKMYLVARGSGDAGALTSVIRAEVQRLDPNLPLGEVRTIERVLSASADPPRFVMLLMTIFAALALLLAAVGIYGILSYNVNQRAREIGVRLALGARPADVVRLVLSEGLTLAVAGAALGVIGALAGARWLASMLYGVAPTDPLTLGAVVLIVLVVALLACAAPGRRAALADPMQTFRS